ncbi:IS21 family transposase, partial [Ornithinimicrobium sp. LYQ103]
MRTALADAVPPPRRVPEREAPVTGVHVELVRSWLVADLDAPRKQRHTARRVWARLTEEEGAVVAESTVRNMVAGLRTEIGAGRAQVMIVQEHPPGEEAEV